MEQTIIDDKAVFATVRSSDTAIARARLSGTIVALKVDEGAQVKRGQLIGDHRRQETETENGSRSKPSLKAAKSQRNAKRSFRS